MDLERYLLGIPQEIMDIRYCALCDNKNKNCLMRYLPSSCAFIPTFTNSSNATMDWIEANLPPYLEAWSLCETFFENGAYM